MSQFARRVGVNGDKSYYFIPSYVVVQRGRIGRLFGVGGLEVGDRGVRGGATVPNGVVE